MDFKAFMLKTAVCCGRKHKYTDNYRTDTKNVKNIFFKVVKISKSYGEGTLADRPSGAPGDFLRAVLACR